VEIPNDIGQNLVKYVPSWMPGAQFQRDAAEWRKSIEAGCGPPFEMVKRLRVSIPNSDLDDEELTLEYPGCWKSGKLFYFVTTR
jgi:hypothetical protein